MSVLENFIKTIQLGDIGFSLTRMPDDDELHFILQNNNGTSLPLDWLSRTGYYIQPFEKSTPTWINADQYIKFGISSFIDSWSKLADGYKLKDVNLFESNEFVETSKSDYDFLFDKAKDSIEKNHVEKVVISRCAQFETHLNWGQLIDTFINAIHKYPKAFISLVHLPGSGIWFGVSPEVFLRKNKSGYNIDALAGSKKNKGGNPNNVIWGDKEKQEQSFVENYIEDVLQLSGVEGYQKVGPETISAGPLWHLRTRFKLANETQIAPLIKQLHPTPAVCGMPKWESMDFIVANEPYERSWYTGFWGPVNLANKEGVQFYVNLRCLHWSGKRLSLFAGGGITLGSELDKEWEETEVKMNTLRDVLAL